MTDDSDELMSRWRRGDAGAFEALYRLHRAPLYRFVLRQVDESGTAEEIYQDVWERVIRHGHRYKPSQPFAAWLYTIARNRVVDHHRAARLRVTEAVDEENVTSLKPDWPEATLLIRDCVERLKAMVRQLSEAQRTAFLLREEAGLGLEEIARITDVGRETVKSRLRYALQYLRGGLKDCDE